MADWGRDSRNIGIDYMLTEAVEGGAESCGEEEGGGRGRGEEMWRSSRKRRGSKEVDNIESTGDSSPHPV